MAESPVQQARNVTGLARLIGASFVLFGCAQQAANARTDGAPFVAPQAELVSRFEGAFGREFVMEHEGEVLFHASHTVGTQRLHVATPATGNTRNIDGFASVVADGRVLLARQNPWSTLALDSPYTQPGVEVFAGQPTNTASLVFGSHLLIDVRSGLVAVDEAWTVSPFFTESIVPEVHSVQPWWMPPNTQHRGRRIEASIGVVTPEGTMIVVDGRGGLRLSIDGTSERLFEADVRRWSASPDGARLVYNPGDAVCCTAIMYEVEGGATMHFPDVSALDVGFSGSWVVAPSKTPRRPNDPRTTTLHDARSKATTRVDGRHPLLLTLNDGRLLLRDAADQTLAFDGRRAESLDLPSTSAAHSHSGPIGFSSDEDTLLGTVLRLTAKDEAQVVADGVAHVFLHTLGGTTAFIQPSRTNPLGDQRGPLIVVHPDGSRDIAAEGVTWYQLASHTDADTRRWLYFVVEAGSNGQALHRIELQEAHQH